MHGYTPNLEAPGKWVSGIADWTASNPEAPHSEALRQGMYGKISIHGVLPGSFEKMSHSLVITRQRRPHAAAG